MQTSKQVASKQVNMMLTAENISEKSTTSLLHSAQQWQTPEPARLKSKNKASCNKSHHMHNSFQARPMTYFIPRLLVQKVLTIPFRPIQAQANPPTSSPFSRHLNRYPDASVGRT